MEWRGRAVVGQAIWIVGGTVLSVNRAPGESDVFASGFGGVVVVEPGSNVSWYRDLDFSGNTVEKVAGALYST